MTMPENSTEGVRYYSGRTLPPEGVYADIKDGKEYGYCSLVTISTIAVAALIVYLLAVTW